MNYPIIVSSPWALECEEVYHYGEILDAGINGIRLRVADFGSVPLGTTLRLICQPLTDNEPDNRCMPAAIQTTAVWADAGTRAFALAYMH